MPFELPFGVAVLNPLPVDYYSGPYTASNIQQAINIASASIPYGVRFQSMEVRLIIDGVSKKYWYRDNITDLVEFSSVGSGNSDIFYNLGGTVSATNSTTAIYRTGSVGIGLTATSGLSASLHIKGNSSVSGNSLLVENSSNTQLLKVLNNGQIILGDSNSAAAPASSVQGVFIIGPGNSNYGSNTSNPNLLTFIVGSTDPTFVSGIQGASANHGNVRSGIYFTNNASDIVFRTGPTATLPERMRINVSGNVGIGTASPSTKLHIYATQSGAFRLQDGSQGNGYILKSDSNGVASWTPLSSVGISGSASYIPVFTGTSSLGNSILYIEPFYGRALIINPGRTLISTLSYLSVQRAQSQVDIILGNPGYGQNSGIVSDNTDGFDISSKGPLVFNSGTSYSEAMRISTNGNVGIGLTGPSTKLHVFSTQSGAFRLEDGTQGPGYLLASDVNGVASWTASTYAPDSNVVHKTGNESISGIKTFQNIGVLTSVVVQNYNTNTSSSALLVQIGNPGMGIKSENTSSGIGIYSNSTSTGLNYVGANSGVTTFSVNKTGEVYATKIGVGTASPSTTLHIFATQSGAFRLQDGTQSYPGYVLTSDANGVGTWQGNPQITLSGATATALATWNNATIMCNFSANCLITIPDTGLPPNFSFRFIVISTNSSSAITFTYSSPVSILPNTLLTFAQYESGVIDRYGATGQNYYITY